MVEGVIVYKIDGTDTIVSVSENWCDFAYKNDWNGKILPDKVVGHKLWDFIQGFETKHLYKTIIDKVRSGKKINPIPFRCDSPEERRFLELEINYLPEVYLEFISRTIKTVPRNPLKLLDNQAARSDEFIKICSLCKKINIPPEKWAEIEEWLVESQLFYAETLPQLSHGLCSQCYETAMAEIDSMFKK